MTQTSPTYIEYAQFGNGGMFRGWVEIGTFPTKRRAWEVLKAHGFTCAGKGNQWNAVPGNEDDVSDSEWRLFAAAQQVAA